jgi:topoisomerase-4 subunit B
MESLKGSNANIQINRFKGLGEMNPSQLKETTMDKEKRQLVKIETSDLTRSQTDEFVRSLMGKNPEFRFNFISKNSKLLDKAIII